MNSFVTNQAQVATSVQAFMDAPEYWRDAVSSRPKFFVHVEGPEGPLFGLSKFCAFSAISLEDYVVKWRRTANGTTTRKRIAKICGKPWVPIRSVPRKLRRDFLSWFRAVSGGRLSTKELHLLTTDVASKTASPKRRTISPEDLQRRLAHQTKIGSIGESVAMKYERQRLLGLGATKSTIDLQQVSKVNAAAGFDIRSCYRKRTRYIEVKTSVSLNGPLFISPNEISTLQKHGKAGYLYLVHVTDVRKRVGTVHRVIQNPMRKGVRTAWLSPALFTGKPPAHSSTV